MKKMRVILTITLAIILSVGMTVNAYASGGDVNIYTTINGKEHQIYFPAGSEAAIAYNRDVKPLLPSGRGQMSAVAITAMDGWKSKYANPQTGSNQQTQEAEKPSQPWLSPELVQQERQELIRLINNERERVGSNRLTIDDDLMEFASIRADEGGRAGGSPHTRPNGDFVYNELASSWQSAQEVFNGWMNSPAHKDAMLGIGVWAKHPQRTIGVGIGEGGSIMIFNEIKYGAPPAK